VGQLSALVAGTGTCGGTGGLRGGRNSREKQSARSKKQSNGSHGHVPLAELTARIFLRYDRRPYEFGCNYLERKVHFGSGQSALPQERACQFWLGCIS
jgi:hypothetical protein